MRSRTLGLALRTVTAALALALLTAPASASPPPAPQAAPAPPPAAAKAPRVPMPTPEQIRLAAVMDQTPRRPATAANVEAHNVVSAKVADIRLTANEKAALAKRELPNRPGDPREHHLSVAGANVNVGRAFREAADKSLKVGRPGDAANYLVQAAGAYKGAASALHYANAIDVVRGRTAPQLREQLAQIKAYHAAPRARLEAELEASQAELTVLIARAPTTRFSGSAEAVARDVTPWELQAAQYEAHAQNMDARGFPDQASSSRTIASAFRERVAAVKALAPEAYNAPYEQRVLGTDLAIAQEAGMGRGDQRTEALRTQKAALVKLGPTRYDEAVFQRVAGAADKVSRVRLALVSDDEMEQRKIAPVEAALAELENPGRALDSRAKVHNMLFTAEQLEGRAQRLVAPPAK